MARILVVDDEQDVLELLVKRLRADGHEVLAAASGAEALAAVARHGLPEAAILDVDLPGMDGVELLDQLRRIRADLPAMFLTVLWDGTAVARVRDTGALYMRKPFTTQSLRTALDLVLVPG
ncbi:response regulator [Dactylosporangium aurantiacum]|uniref:Response regulator n=1 Tax=Dactylosporangium aurantiacum TaxID=35754 RepID=A0A9Q9IDF8_9ACTN|nr:response regulator [Dactylosporangium aurantiacum]MDG6107509.1 response regulator [Dactylosporangium aurantiacum]UWZ54299.1 response regulator [Dactylosporangium aurantiacum]